MLKEAVLGSIVVLIGVVAVYLFLNSPPVVLTDFKGESDVADVPVSGVEPVSARVSEKTNTAAKDVPDVAKFMDEGMRHQFQKVAQQYQQDIQFPSYSKPLKSTDWAQLNPLPFIPQRLALSASEDVSAEIVLPHYQITRGDELTVQVRIMGDQLHIGSVEATLAHAHQQSSSIVSVQLQQSTTQQSEYVYDGVVSRRQLESLDDGEILVRASIRLQESGVNDLVATFELSDSVAQLTEVGDAFIDGADLVIPLAFDVEEAGLYRVRANLFDQASGDPISHLNSAFKLSRFQNTGQLKAHAATLRHAGSGGPYVLTDISVIKAPETPGEKSAYGSSVAEEFPVSGFDLDAYSREEYQDPLNQKRLEFLQRMSSQPM